MDKDHIPADFRYKHVLEKGKPEHEKTDPFRIRHPVMPVAKRAKIFAPFDALRGFNEAIKAKEKESLEESSKQ